MTGYDIELTATKWGILKFVMSDDFDEEYTLAISTVCPGSSDPPEKCVIYFHQKMRFTPFINYNDTLG